MVFIDLIIVLFIHFVYFFICLFILLVYFLFIYLYICLSIYLSIYVCGCLTYLLTLSACLLIWLFDWVFYSLCWIIMHVSLTSDRLRLVPCCTPVTGRVYTAGGRTAARSRQGRCSAAGKRLRWKDSPPSPAHRRQEGRHQSRYAAARQCTQHW